MNELYILLLKSIFRKPMPFDVSAGDSNNHSVRSSVTSGNNFKVFILQNLLNFIPINTFAEIYG
jgi:hypothetical protein